MSWEIMEKNRFGEEILFTIYFIYNFKCFFFLHWHCNIGETLSVALIVVIMAYVCVIYTSTTTTTILVFAAGDVISALVTIPRLELTRWQDTHWSSWFSLSSHGSRSVIPWDNFLDLVTGPHYSQELRECDGVFSLLHLLIFPHSKSKNIPGRKYQYNNIGRAVGGEVS